MLSFTLNEKILRLAPRFTVNDNAPSDFKSLVQAPSLIIWAGASDNTIYGDKAVNWAFRAWHDSLHIALNADFTLQGEIRVALEQARQLESDYLAKVMLAEIKGQAEYFAINGQFPADQASFINKYMLSLK